MNRYSLPKLFLLDVELEGVYESGFAHREKSGVGEYSQPQAAGLVISQMRREYIPAATKPPALTTRPLVRMIASDHWRATVFLT